MSYLQALLKPLRPKVTVPASAQPPLPSGPSPSDGKPVPIPPPSSSDLDAFPSLSDSNPTLPSSFPSAAVKEPTPPASKPNASSGFHPTSSSEIKLQTVTAVCGSPRAGTTPSVSLFVRSFSSVRKGSSAPYGVGGLVPVVAKKVSAKSNEPHLSTSIDGGEKGSKGTVVTFRGTASASELEHVVPPGKESDDEQEKTKQEVMAALEAAERAELEQLLADEEAKVEAELKAVALALWSEEKKEVAVAAKAAKAAKAASAKVALAEIAERKATAEAKAKEREAEAAQRRARMKKERAAEKKVRRSLRARERKENEKAKAREEAELIAEAIRLSEEEAKERRRKLEAASSAKRADVALSVLKARGARVVQSNRDSSQTQPDEVEDCVGLADVEGTKIHRFAMCSDPDVAIVNDNNEGLTVLEHWGKSMPYVVSTMFGTVRWPAVPVGELDFGDLSAVDFRKGCVRVYGAGMGKQRGEGLNRPAVVTFFSSLRDYGEGALVVLERFSKRLERCGGKLLEIDLWRDRVIFSVSHFSKYSLSGDDDDDDGSEEMQLEERSTSSSESRVGGKASESSGGSLASASRPASDEEMRQYYAWCRSRANRERASRAEAMSSRQALEEEEKRFASWLASSRASAAKSSPVAAAMGSPRRDDFGRLSLVSNPPLSVTPKRNVEACEEFDFGSDEIGSDSDEDDDIDDDDEDNSDESDDESDDDSDFDEGSTGTASQVPAKTKPSKASPGVERKQPKIIYDNDDDDDDDDDDDNFNENESDSDDDCLVLDDGLSQKKSKVPSRDSTVTKGMSPSFLSVLQSPGASKANKSSPRSGFLKVGVRDGEEFDGVAAKKKRDSYGSSAIDLKVRVKYAEYIAKRMKHPWNLSKDDMSAEFSLPKAKAYVSHLVSASAENMKKHGCHLTVYNSLKSVVLASLIRMAKGEASRKNFDFDKAAWADFRFELQNLCKEVNMPVCGGDSYMGSLAFFEYIFRLAPQGSDHFNNFRGYCSFLLCGSRRQMIDNIRPMHIHEINRIVCRMSIGKEKMKTEFVQKEMLVSLPRGKTWNKKRLKTIWILGPDEYADKESLLNPLVCLEAISIEKFGRTLEELLVEKNERTRWWKKNRKIKFFEGCHTTYFANLLKKYASIAGMPLGLKLTLHTASRSGGLDGAMRNVEQGKVGNDSVNSNFGWNGKGALSKIAKASYGGTQAVTQRVYANQLTNPGAKHIYRSDFVPKPVAGEIRGPLSHLVDELRRDSFLQGVKWIHDPEKAGGSCEDDWDLVKRVLDDRDAENRERDELLEEDGLSENARKKVRNHAVMLCGLVSLGVEQGFKSETALFRESKQAILREIRGMPRDVMKDWVLNSMLVDSDARKSWKQIRKEYYSDDDAEMSDTDYTTLEAMFDVKKVREAYKKVGEMTLQQLVETVVKQRAEEPLTFSEIVALHLKTNLKDELQAFATHYKIKAKFWNPSPMSAEDSVAYEKACLTLNKRGSKREWSDAASSELQSFLRQHKGEFGVMRLPRYISCFVIPSCPLVRADGRTALHIKDKVRNLKLMAFRIMRREAEETMQKERYDDTSEDSSGESSDEENAMRKKRSRRERVQKKSPHQKKSKVRRPEKSGEKRRNSSIAQSPSRKSAVDERANIDIDFSDDSEVEVLLTVPPSVGIKKPSPLLEDGRDSGDSDIEVWSFVSDVSIPSVNNSSKQIGSRVDKPRINDSGRNVISGGRSGRVGSVGESRGGNDREVLGMGRGGASSSGRLVRGDVGGRGRLASGGRGRGGGGGGNGDGWGGGGGNDNDGVNFFVMPQGGLQAYSGDYQYGNPWQNPFTFVMDQQGNVVPNTLHGLHQPGVLGAGLPVDVNNPCFSCSGVFDPAWIVPLSPNPQIGNKHNGCFKVTANSHFDGLQCYICSFLFRPNQVAVALEQRNLLPVHYCCSIARVFDYVYSRFQACLCQQFVPELLWAISANEHQPPRNAPPTWSYTWTYIEVIDLFVALKLSGNLPPMLPPFNAPPQVPPGVDWDVVLSYGPVLRSTRKTAAMLERAWTSQRQHIRTLMTPAFLTAAVAPGLQTNMP
jgi:hypothetical protein